MPKIAKLALLSLVLGCDAQVTGGDSLDGGDATIDLAPSPIATPDLASDLAQPWSACGDHNPGCTVAAFGPPQHPFPLQSDPNPDPAESDQGVTRDGNGYLELGAAHANFDFLWLANTGDWNAGTVSKVDSKMVHEVARYASVTCFSNSGGSRAGCDGMTGCCTRDDYTRFGNRKLQKPDGPHEPINQFTNFPSRTAVDYNGDVWVANRAFGVQSSVTKIANDPSECIDRNGVAGVQTSSDVDGDGVIDTDCNRDGVADDIAGVKAKPCVNGKAQEFYGLDDECILFTTNTNVSNQWGRPLALGQGGVDFGPSDAWAGTFQDGKFFRVDGATGEIKAEAHVNGHPYGATIDASGILWAPNIGAGLNYFDTANPGVSAAVRAPKGFTDANYGVTLDRDQNVWTGGLTDGSAYRYTPDRGNGFAVLGQGFWTRVSTVGSAAGATSNGRGIAADSRTMKDYFVWMARDGGTNGGWIVRIPASTIPLPNGADTVVDGSGMAAMRVAGTDTIGAGVDAEQNIWGVSHGGSVATRIKVDAAGNMTAPDLHGGVDNAGCPVGGGDRCTLGLTGTKSNPAPYTYSDFTGFGLRNFTNPKGFYSFVQKGCTSEKTKWMKILFDGVVPAGTQLTVRARSGSTPVPDAMTWGAWTQSSAVSPDELAPALMPNPAGYLQVELDFSTVNRTTTPKLKSFQLLYECSNDIG